MQNLFFVDFKNLEILRPETEELGSNKIYAHMNHLLTTLSFSYFIELIKVNKEVKQRFYESNAIQSNWNIRDLKRVIDSVLFERTELGSDK